MSIRKRIAETVQKSENILSDPIYVRLSAHTKEKLRIVQKKFKIKSLSEAVRVLVEDRLEELEKDSSDEDLEQESGSGQTPASATG